jgi:hypothetical protein
MYLEEEGSIFREILISWTPLTLKKDCTTFFRKSTRRNNPQDLNPPSFETFGLHHQNLEIKKSVR